MIGQNAQANKNMNRATVIKLIQQNHSIFRSEIAQKTGLTRAAITKIVQSLIALELVCESAKDQDDESNKKQIPLSINDQKYRTLSISIGRSSIVGALFNISGEVLLLLKREYEEGSIDQKEILALLFEIVQKILDVSHTNSVDVLGIGIAAPGAVNTGDGPGEECEDPVNAPPYLWNRLQLKEKLKERFGLDAYLENNCNISALGERWYGAGRGIEDFAVYSVGIGIGAGVVADGSMMNGQNDVFSEIGHVTVDLRGPICSCGNTGCLELYAGAKALVENYYRACDYEIYGMSFKEYSTAVELILAKAADGDERATRIIDDHSRILAIGAVSLANLFGPKRIIVIPDEIGDADYARFIPAMREAVSLKAFKAVSCRVEVVPSPLGKTAALYGGAALVLEKFLEKGDLDNGNLPSEDGEE